MATFNWEEIEEKAGGNKNFKDFAKNGDHTVKADGVEMKKVGEKGSVIMKFHFEETEDAKYPTADHWLSFNNINWRRWHNKCLMEVLGATEDAAKKAVEMAEKSDKKEDIINGYTTMYEKLLAKKPEVEIEVSSDGKYQRAEFKDRRVAMPHNDKPKAETSEDILNSGEELKEDDLPF